MATVTQSLWQTWKLLINFPGLMPVSAAWVQPPVVQPTQQQSHTRYQGLQPSMLCWDKGVALKDLQQRGPSHPPTMLWRRISWTSAILYVNKVHHNKTKTVHLNRIKLHALTWSLCFLRHYTSQSKYDSTFIFSDNLGKYFRFRIL